MAEWVVCVKADLCGNVWCPHAGKHRGSATCSLPCGYAYETECKGVELNADNRHKIQGV